MRSVFSLMLVLAFTNAIACSGEDCAGSLAYQGYGNNAKPKAVVIFLHGSVSSGGPADYMYKYAKQFSENHADVISIALLAPGYYDRNGKQSDGSDSGRRLSDDTDSLIEAIKVLSAKYGTRRIYAVGHSKGAMNLAGILGKQPGLISGAILVAGVYDLQTLANSRGRMQNGIQGIDLLPSVSKETRIILIHGDNDSDVPLSQSLSYTQKARDLGLKPELIVIPNEGHSFNRPLSTTVIEQLNQLVN
jgi:predicted esterase